MKRYKPKWNDSKVVDWKKIKERVYYKDTKEELEQSLKYHLTQCKRIRLLLKGY